MRLITHLRYRLKRLFLPYEFPDHPLYYPSDKDLERMKEEQELDDLFNDV